MNITVEQLNEILARGTVTVAPESDPSFFASQRREKSSGNGITPARGKSGLGVENPRVVSAFRENRHAEFLDQLVELAHLHGWRVAAVRPARVRVGGTETYRTAWQYDGQGFPDLVLARAGRVLFWEVKVGHDRPRPSQLAWLAEVGGRVIRPEDWDWIQEALR